MKVYSEIEIEATPEECREVFLDFRNFHEIKSDLVRSITRKPANKEGPVEKGELLACDFVQAISDVTVLENTTQEFTWRGDVWYVLSGVHSYFFKPSEITPGHTTFVNTETYMRLNVVFMRFMDAQGMYDKFCRDFKARVESVLRAKREEGK
ncbi:hypothetical protein BGZ60DRAFT_526211 [Tricladium varicosporioides]|nr:hypothetical protein BGZ60DRAFT_526211 [Hymenoscyphus varicosporioides]